MNADGILSFCGREETANALHDKHTHTLTCIRVHTGFTVHAHKLRSAARTLSKEQCTRSQGRDRTHSLVFGLHSAKNLK